MARWVSYLCAGIAAAVCLSLFAGTAPVARACFGYTLACENASMSDYDGGAVDVEFHEMTVNEQTVSPGGSHEYRIHYTYYPGCGNTYSWKFALITTGLPAGWSLMLMDSPGGGGSSVWGVERSMAYSGQGDVYMTVTADANATVGQSASVTARLWCNDTAACNEHNTLDTKTSTKVGTGPAPPPSVALTSPAGGEYWTIGTNHDITWTASSSIGDVTIKLDYSTLGSGGPWTFLADSEPNDGVYTWTVPNKESANCFVRVTATDLNSQSSQASNPSPFTILSGTAPVAVSLLVPNGGNTTWDAGQNAVITWSASGGSGALEIALDYSSAGSGGPWTSVATGETNDGTYNWLVPNTPSTDCYVKITATDTGGSGGSATDVGDGPFTIKAASSVKPTIAVTRPNGGESFTPGASELVQWSAIGGTGNLTVDLQYSTAGQAGPWTDILTGQYNNGTAVWVVPNTPSTDCYVKAIATDEAATPQSGEDISNAPFTISQPGGPSDPSIVITSPNGGEIWDINSAHAITWATKNGTAPILVSLEYSLSGPSGPWTSIATAQPDSGAYSWTAPGTPSTAACIRATATDSAATPRTATDTSDGNFIIQDPATPVVRPAIAIISPNGGEAWEAGSAHEVQWIANGGTGALTINLEFSTTGAGGPWIPVSPAETNDGTYTWTVPSVDSTDCYLKATASDTLTPPKTAVMVSNHSFSITPAGAGAPQVDLLDPDGGENWLSGSSHDVTWTATGGTGDIFITLAYSTSGAGGPWSQIAASVPNSGSYAWTVPPTLSANCYVRATATDSATVPKSASDTSAAAFQISEGCTIRGTVKDPAGAAVSGATVKIYKGNLMKSQYTSSSSGAYTFTVEPGTYTLTAEKTGFKKTDAVSVTVAAGDDKEQNLQFTKTDSASGPGLMENPVMAGVIIAMVLVVVFVLIALMFLLRRRKAAESGPFSGDAGPAQAPQQPYGPSYPQQGYQQPPPYGQPPQYQQPPPPHGQQYPPPPQQ